MQPRRMRLILFSSLYVLLGVPLAAASPAITDDGPRFDRVTELPVGQADWVSMDGSLVAFGSGTRVFLVETIPTTVVEREFTLETPIEEAVLAGNRLYVNVEGRRLQVLDLDAPEAGLATVALSPLPRGSLHIARMDDYLLVAEDGYGLRILALPPPPGHRHAGHFPHHRGLDTVGTLMLDETFGALASSVRSVYLSLASGQMAVVSAHRPDQPFLLRTEAIGTTITALAANGKQIHFLGPQGLTILDLSRPGEPRTLGTYPEVNGADVELAGRAVFVAGRDQGLVAFRDQATRAATIMVTVSDFSFTPTNPTIAVGDTVQWNNILGIHNVEACDGVLDPIQCGGQVAAQGAFTSGAAAPAPWSFSKTFTVIGNNPYFCVVHVGIGMTGLITVQAPAANHFVTVSGFVFNPASLVVNPGDVVQWDNVEGLHNVESCDGAGDPIACGGQTAVEGAFVLPGGPSSLPWTFQQMFNTVGGNPYFCVVHVGIGMSGLVTTAPPPPPPVPDGSNASPLLVDKGTPFGTLLNLTWNTATCTGNIDHQIIFGPGGTLPAVLGGTYNPPGGVCAIGGSPFAWVGVPPPAPFDFLWFLVLATDGANTEGSWGPDALGNERTGPLAGGASGQCVANKDVTNTCP